MNLEALQQAVNEIKVEIHSAVTTSSYGKISHEHGGHAKNALIRSASLIQRIHEVTKRSIVEELIRRGRKHQVHPPLNRTSPELSVWGTLKKKKQDIVVLIGDATPSRELIIEGPLLNQYDELGITATKSAIVVGVRSQLSSVDKNFDTLMERAFAETLNLRMRHPYLVMSEVYLLAVRDYNDKSMKVNEIKWKSKLTNIERFISIFNAMSHRKDIHDPRESFKYERSVLLLVDFSHDKPKIYTTEDELRADGIISDNFISDYSGLSPVNYARDLINAYDERHSIASANYL